MQGKGDEEVEALKKRLADRSQAVSPEDEIKSDVRAPANRAVPVRCLHDMRARRAVRALTVGRVIQVGISQFVGEKAEAVSKEDVGTVMADMTNSKMSLARLLWSRGVDAVQDLLDPIDKPRVRSRDDKAAAGLHRLVVLGSGWGAHALLKSPPPRLPRAALCSPRTARAC